MSCDVSASQPLAKAAEDLFSQMLRSEAAPMTISSMAYLWDECARAVVLDAAVFQGGGSFSSYVGVWESFPTTAQG